MNVVHSCLQVRDIQWAIFVNFLSGDDEWPRNCGDSKDRKTLSSLARTCVTFKETALDLLWRDLKSLEPVIKILPKDLWTLREKRDGAWREPTTCIISFTRMLKQQDLHRFDYYAPRVFGLACPETMDTHVRYLWRMETAVYASFAFMRPGSPLLPNLRHACIRETASLSSSLFVFPSPTLVHLDIKSGFLYDDKDNMGLYDQITNAFSSLPKLSPHLESLSLDILCLKRFRPLLKSSIGVMIATLPKLHTLSMPDCPLFDETLLRKVGSHLKLRHWALMLDPIEWPEEEESSSVRLTLAQFPKLRSMKLTSGSLERLDAVIMILRLPMNNLQLKVTDFKRALSLHSFALFAWKFSNNVCTSTLTTLRLDIDIEDFDADDASNACRPFFAFRNLREFEVYSDFIFYIDDEWLQEAATAWPHLQQLELFPRAQFEYRGLLNPWSTLDGLFYIIQNCRDLNTLTINILVYPFNPDAFDGVYNSNITTINFQRSEIDGDPGDVLQTLLTLFPNLRDIDVWGDKSGLNAVRKLLAKRLTSHSSPERLYGTTKKEP